jgi:putative transposase
MTHYNTRYSWDTVVKHYIRKGLFDHLPEHLKAQIPKSNKSRWSKELDSKYTGCEVASFINQELELIKRTGQSRNAKRILETYLNLSDTYHQIITNIKGIKSQIASHKETIVNVIEKVKDCISIDNAIKLFGISRATYQSYKTLVINKCEESYFEWCLKQYPQQLLHREIQQIKKYLTHKNYKNWSKSSVYLLALRNKDISFCLATFYKYSKLLGFKSNRHIQPKEIYTPLKSTYPNEIWCADVTIYKTLDGVKHYIHFLIDHYSKKCLGFRIEKSASPKAIKSLLQDAYSKYKIEMPLQFVSDAGIENVNNTIKEFLKSTNRIIIHKIAQKDIKQSNSQIEAFNKIIKHQFLIPRKHENSNQLHTTFPKDIEYYNSIRPQLSLQGNTPDETFYGKIMNMSSYKTHFIEHKMIRTALNKENICKKCK